MNPSAFLDSATGIVVVALVFAPIILAVIALLAIILAVVNRRHRERMKMIEQGMMPPPPRKQKGNYYGLLITGAIFLAFGLALFAGKLAEGSNDLTGGFIFGFIGLAMLACFAIIRAARKTEPVEKNGGFPPAPAPPPPQP
jgi:phosphatidylglycerophosphate synthase